MTDHAFDYPRHQALWRAVAPRIADADLAHDADHVLRVYRWALRLAPEAEADADLAGAAALVHDLVNVPKESAERAAGGRRSADASRALLAQAGYDDGEIETITGAVARGSWSAQRAPESAVGLVLQDADRLDAIGAIGIARTLSYAQAIRSRGGALRLADPDDPLAEQREHDERRFAVDHFFTKLLRISEGLRLPSARAEGQRRQAEMQRFLAALARELGPDDTRR